MILGSPNWAAEDGVTKYGNTLVLRGQREGSAMRRSRSFRTKMMEICAWTGKLQNPHPGKIGPNGAPTFLMSLNLLLPQGLYRIETGGAIRWAAAGEQANQQKYGRDADKGEGVERLGAEQHSFE